MRQIRKDLNTLREKDLINLLLFTIYKLTDDPKYATISELIYTVDKDSLYNLCSIYGGMTIKIPTIKELELVINVLLVYQYINFENKTLDDACELVKINKSKELVDLLNKITEIINNYE